MSELRIRKLEEWVTSVLRARARRHGRSLEEELRTLLRDEVLREKKLLADRAEARLDKLREKYGTFSDSTALIRADRDARGMIAIDANIAAKWYLPEEGSALALALLRTPNQLIAPALIKMEVCAALTRRVRLKEMSAAEAQEHCEEWFVDLDEDAVQLIPEQDFLRRAVELSVQLRHSLQDCLYLAVAERHGVPLLTADEPFFKKAVTFYPETHLLSKWRMN